MGCRKLSYYEQATERNEFSKYSYANELTPINTTTKAHSKYTYGFNGMEKDDEVKESGNSVNYKARIYDPRLGRFMSVDPLTRQFPFYSPYQFAGNKSIQAIDLDGKEEFIRTNYFDAVGTLYRTELQVTTAIGNSGGMPRGIGSTQIVHTTNVTVGVNGNATAIYAGATIGTLTNVNGLPGSTAFTPIENQAITNTTNITPTGSIRNEGGVQADGKSFTNTVVSYGPNGPSTALRDNRGRDISTNDREYYGVLTLNLAPAPANEPLLPVGFNVTPTLGNRFAAAGSNFIPPVLLNNIGTILPIETDLNRPSVVGTTQSQAPGTTDTAPGSDGSGDKTIIY